ncbi:MATE family efflux transporter [Desulfosporosinus metallidurans]|uniref:Multidrug export protein MepA n=1 Tax=Desulfosporosinus metallidurans TaxID=1888891 RepID=A0A1Q8QYY2_9FIRM|nr:MATE family efflux transporter [Desulfosporosinus metallidurans]OLN32526.1 MATE efflux family protein [Desulfosporosinus metallidurans]
MIRSQQLGEEKIGKLLLSYSVPAIIGMLVNGLYNIVDRIFVGRGVGSLALSGIAISFPITLAIMAFGMLIGIGATSVISIRLGQQKREEAERIVGNAFSLLVGISLIITLLGYLFMDPLLVGLGASSEVLPYAKQYISVLLGGAVFQSIGFGMNNFIRAEGNPRIAMYTMILGAVLNTILNPIFIFGLHIGVAGSALATVISQFVTAAWVMYYFLGNKAMLKLRLRNLQPEWILVKDILGIGLSPFAMQLVGSFVTVFLNNALAIHGGDLSIAAMGVITSITMLIFMPIFGIGQGVQPILGFNYGARRYDRVKQALKLAVIGATGVMIFGFLIVELFPAALMSLFSTDPELVRIGASGMRIYLMMLPIIGFQVTVVGYFQATGKPRKSLFLSLSRQLIFLVPMIWILPKFWGLSGVWLASPVSDFASAVLTAVWLSQDLKLLHYGESIVETK